MEDGETDTRRQTGLEVMRTLSMEARCSDERKLKYSLAKRTKMPQDRA